MIDKRLLTDEVTIYFKDIKNEFGDTDFQNSITLKNVRFDRSDSVSGIDNNRLRSKSGTIFMYGKYFKGIVDKKWLGAKVISNNKEYKITGYQTNFFKGKLFSYEIEVI